MAEEKKLTKDDLSVSGEGTPEKVEPELSPEQKKLEEDQLKQQKHDIDHLMSLPKEEIAGKLYDLKACMMVLYKQVVPSGKVEHLAIMYQHLVEAYLLMKNKIDGYYKHPETIRWKKRRTIAIQKLRKVNITMEGKPNEEFMNGVKFASEKLMQEFFDTLNNL